MTNLASAASAQKLKQTQVNLVILNPGLDVQVARKLATVLQKTDKSSNDFALINNASDDYFKNILRDELERL
jgi:hypothetical protein